VLSAITFNNYFTTRLSVIKPIILLLGAHARVGATFGEGKGPIFLYDVHCFGTEPRINACSGKADGLHNCTHLQDAGVVCSGI